MGIPSILQYVKTIKTTIGKYMVWLTSMTWPSESIVSICSVYFWLQRVYIMWLTNDADWHIIVTRVNIYIAIIYS